MTRAARLVLAFGCVLAVASPSRADVGVIVLEPISALGFFTRVGHAGTYFSNICQDGSPVKMRLCLPGERGSVVSKYSPLSEHEDYDWAIVPFEEYMHGFESPDLAPLIGTRKLQRVIERYNFGPLFSRALKTSETGELPDGQWKTALATRFDRTIYIFSVETTAVDDALLVAAFNAAPNESRFNFFYRNCSNQAKRIFDLILPRLATIGNRTSGVTMETPKGLAKALVDRALADPELELRVRRYVQIPGTFSRSSDVLFPMENTYRNIGFAPWWFFGGFREVAFGAMFYHQMISPFDMLESARNFASPRAAALTREQQRLRQRQDAVRLALATAESERSRRVRVSEARSVFQRLSAIRTEQEAEVSRMAGTKAEWQALDREFQSIVRDLSRRRFVPEALKPHFAQSAPSGRLSASLLQYFEASGDFYVDEDRRGPWISLPLMDGEMSSTGLSTSHILAGDPRVAALVLAAVIDHHLRQSDGRREALAYVDGLFTAFRQASAAIDAPAEASSAPVSRRP